MIEHIYLQVTRLENATETIRRNIPFVLKMTTGETVLLWPQIHVPGMKRCNPSICPLGDGRGRAHRIDLDALAFDGTQGGARFVPPRAVFYRVRAWRLLPRGSATQTPYTGGMSEGFNGSMARKVSRELSGRMIRQDQVERLVEVVEREFPSSSERKFSIANEDGVFTDASLDTVMAAAGRPTVVDNLAISDRVGEKVFVFEAKPGWIKFTAEGGEQHFPVGFCEEVQAILRTRTIRLRRLLPARMRRITDWCLPVEAVLAAIAILVASVTAGWPTALSVTCISALVLLTTWVARRRFSTYILLKDDAREPWKRTEKLALVGLTVPIIVALIVNGPNWVKDDGPPTTPKSGSTGHASDPSDGLGSRAATPGLSRDNERSPLTKVTVEPAVGSAGEAFSLTGKGFEPDAEVWMSLMAGPGTTLSWHKAERHLVRANSKGEIGPEKIIVGRSVCCSGGTIRVVVVPEDKTAAVETTYKLK